MSALLLGYDESRFTSAKLSASRMQSDNMRFFRDETSKMCAKFSKRTRITRPITGTPSFSGAGGG
jgi:hypothetical protein